MICPRRTSDTRFCVDKGRTFLELAMLNHLLQCESAGGKGRIFLAVVAGFFLCLVYIGPFLIIFAKERISTNSKQSNCYMII